MADRLDSANTPAPASQKEVEGLEDGIQVGKSEQQKLDHLAMQAAKRAGNRMAEDAERLPEDTTFSK